MDHKIDFTERPSSAVDARILKSRAALRDALIALAGEKPFAELTVAEIAKRASVGYATFFRHFPSKEALLADIAESLILDMLALMGPLMRETETRAASLELARFVDTQRAICHALLVGAGDAMRREITLRAIQLSAANRVDMGGDLPGELLSVHSVGATLNILAWWLERGTDIDAEDMAAILDRLVFKPLSPEAC
ncbi:helix-turn-helix domain-containing protein [Flavisphingomonas formosensis]|uniref:helix-turn-helix domain-containing protein n=1 Tax=Flavisphingomonas formosensis TaxID=861534 RepID=UPI0012F79568|nr:helix-turn-helix domain-containing protein [Sphingomonas formosensis]